MRDSDLVEIILTRERIYITALSQSSGSGGMFCSEVVSIDVLQLGITRDLIVDCLLFTVKEMERREAISIAAIRLFKLVRVWSWCRDASHQRQRCSSSLFELSSRGSLLD